MKKLSTLGFRDLYKGLLLVSASLISTNALATPFFIKQVGAVTPDTISITVQVGDVTRGYRHRFNSNDPNYQIMQICDKGKCQPTRWIQRTGASGTNGIIGSLVGKNNNVVQRFDTLSGYADEDRMNALNNLWKTKGTKPSTFKIFKGQNKTSFYPVSVSLKSKPVDHAFLYVDKFAWIMEHTVYLKLPSKLIAGGTRYSIAFNNGIRGSASFNFRPLSNVSEAMHVSQIGFHPNDPVKRAYLSVWKGTEGGETSYNEQNLEFVVLKDGNKQVGPKRKLTKKFDVGQSEELYANKDYTKTKVLAMNFNDIKQEGIYRVCVTSIGCTVDFPIKRNVWKNALDISLQGFKEQQHKTKYKVHSCTVSLMETNNGLDDSDSSNFEDLQKHCSSGGNVLSDAYGGYKDAGDWDRRIQHLKSTMLQFELAEMFPDYFKPTNGNTHHPIITEAEYGLATYLRMFKYGQGVRGGIESLEHPRHGETSVTESQRVVAYAPDMWSTYQYAAAAARAARYFRTKTDARSQVLYRKYRNTSRGAMHWAEKQLTKYNGGKNEKYHVYNYPYEGIKGGVKDARNLAAVELYRLLELTLDDTEKSRKTLEKIHDTFKRSLTISAANSALQKGSYDNSDAAFSYLKTRSGDNTIKRNIRSAITNSVGDQIWWETGSTAFDWTKNSSGDAIDEGVIAIPQAVNLVRAHFSTGDARYLKYALLATQFGAGANPYNMSFTTGLGVKSPQNPHMRDHLFGPNKNGAPPAGITLHGPSVKVYENGYLGSFTQFMSPPFKDWPLIETYLDIFPLDQATEFTVHSALAPNMFVWGYLAAAQR